jgi:hypothetical protein
MVTSSAFLRHGDGSFVAVFAETERDVLINLTEQLIEILAERIDEVHTDPLAAMVNLTGHDSPPEDVVLARLLPNAYADPVDSADFRRFTETELRGKKRAHALLVRSNLLNLEKSTVRLNNESALAWLGALNDIRLALGVRLNVQEQSHEQLELLSPDDPMRGVYAVYTWLGWLQESLVQALMDDFDGLDPQAEDDGWEIQTS